MNVDLTPEQLIVLAKWMLILAVFTTIAIPIFSCLFGSNMHISWKPGGGKKSKRSQENDERLRALIKEGIEHGSLNNGDE